MVPRGSLLCCSRGTFLCQACLLDSSVSEGPCRLYISAATLEVAVLQLLLEQYILIVRGFNVVLNSALIGNAQEMHSWDLLSGYVWTRELTQNAVAGTSQRATTTSIPLDQPDMALHAQHFSHAIYSIIQILGTSSVFSELLRPPVKPQLYTFPHAVSGTNRATSQRRYQSFTKRCSGSGSSIPSVHSIMALDYTSDAICVGIDECFKLPPLVNLRLLMLCLLSSVRVSFMHIAQYHGEIYGTGVLGKTASGVMSDAPTNFSCGSDGMFNSSQMQELVQQTAWILRSDLQSLIQQDIRWVTGPCVLRCPVEHKRKSGCCCYQREENTPVNYATCGASLCSESARLISTALQRSAVELFCCANVGASDIEVFLHTHEDFSG